LREYPEDIIQLEQEIRYRYDIPGFSITSLDTLDAKLNAAIPYIQRLQNFEDTPAIAKTIGAVVQEEDIPLDTPDRDNLLIGFHLRNTIQNRLSVGGSSYDSAVWLVNLAKAGGRKLAVVQ